MPDNYYYGWMFFPSFLPLLYFFLSSPPVVRQLSGTIIHLCKLRKCSYFRKRWVGFPIDISRTFCDDGNVAYLCCGNGSYQPHVATEPLKYGQQDWGTEFCFKGYWQTQCGVRTHDSEIQSRTLHQQSQPGAPGTEFSIVFNCNSFKLKQTHVTGTTMLDSVILKLSLAASPPTEV